MSLADYLWLVRLIIEILKAIADMTESERLAIAVLRTDSQKLTAQPKKPKKSPGSRTPPAVT